MKIDIKTQTPRSTSYRRNVSNVNLFCGDFEVGITTTENWGRFKERAEPLITLEIDGNNYQFNLSEFKQLIRKQKR